MTDRPAPAKLRRLCPWLGDDDSLGARIARRAMCDVGIEEMPPGSNRSPRIDEYVTRVGSDLGSYWCAAAGAAWLDEAGAETPPHDAASTVEWLAWAREEGYVILEPVIGCVILYLDSAGKPHHLGVAVRLAPVLLSVEGNTSTDPAERNGIACFCKQAGKASKIYIAPHPKPESP
jgi:hypothetical protein